MIYIYMYREREKEKQEGLRYIRVRVRPTISGEAFHSPAMSNRTAPARVSIRVPPGPGASAFPLGHRGRFKSNDI